MTDDEGAIDDLVARIMSEGAGTHDAFAEGRKCGGFCAGLRSAAEDFGFPLSLSAAVALTETWMTGDHWIDPDEPDDDSDPD